MRRLLRYFMRVWHRPKGLKQKQEEQAQRLDEAERQLLELRAQLDRRRR